MARFTKIVFAASLAVLLVACNKAPAPSAAPNAPATAPAAAVAAPPAAAPQALTYQCHSAQKTRDIFLRFGTDGALYLGADAADMKPTGDIVLFDKSGVANWSTKRGSWTESNSFDKNKAEWTWTDDPGAGGIVDQAVYQCKPV